jgi:prophage regulatory protein
MQTIPEIGFVRLKQILEVIPLGKTCWWEGVKSGRFPKPVKLSARCTAWRAEDIHKLIREIACQSLSVATSRDDYLSAGRRFDLEMRKALREFRIDEEERPTSTDS